MSEQAVSLLDRGYALIIAFLLPGLIALAGIATINPTVAKWFTGAQEDPSFVGLLFVLLAALALNLLISAVRWYVFEELSVLPRCPLVAPAPRFNMAKRTSCEAQYLDLRHQHYYYYLAHANTAVALVIAVGAWLFSQRAAVGVWPRLAAISLTLVAIVMMATAACNAIKRYDERTLSLLGLDPEPPSAS